MSDKLRALFFSQENRRYERYLDTLDRKLTTAVIHLALHLNEMGEVKEDGRASVFVIPTLFSCTYT